jgi:catechol 2,3-dioxygenase-like lactoylglutathione lyase family enzyme
MQSRQLEGNHRRWFVRWTGVAGDEPVNLLIADASETPPLHRRFTLRKISTMLNVTWDHIHLRSPDPEATANWLHDILGGEIVRNPGRIDVKLGGASVFIAKVEPGDGVNQPPATPHQGLDHFGLTVKDIDAAAAELKAKGVAFTTEPTTIRPGVRICFIRGPQGISIELLERDKKYA